MDARPIDKGKKPVWPGYITHFMGADGDDFKKLFITRDDGSAFVCLYWFDDRPQELVISDLSVEPKSRQNGRATEIMDMVEKALPEMGFSSMVLWSVKESTEHSWYVRRGFVDYADHATNANGVWMRKRLAN